MSNPPPALEGIWQMVRAELDGDLAPELVTSQTVLELSAGTYAVRYAGQAMDSGTYVHGTPSEFTTLVLSGQTGPNAGRTIPCIYQLAGDRLRICYGLDGGTPAEFTAPKHCQRYVATYRRKTREQLRQISVRTTKNYFAL